jgi:L-fuculose-phosphate aldolase
VHAVIHLHPQHAVLVDALGHRIRLSILDHADYLRTVARVPYLPAGSVELAEAARDHDLTFRRSGSSGWARCDHGQAHTR